MPGIGRVLCIYEITYLAMKSKLTILLLALVALPLSAQKKKVTAQPAIDIEQAIREYRFADAEEQLNADIAALRKKKQPTLQEEERLQQIHRAMQKINATERITFIDSVVIPRQQLFDQMRLSSECGSVHNFARFFQKESAAETSVFLSQLGDRIYYAEADAQGVSRLFSADKLGNEWTNREALQGLNPEEGQSQNYPFMMADGTTLYFAAEGEESLGGYDIFMTRYDADEHTFLVPENIGMPFNSMANDYLYAVDEYYNLGYFASDRNQAPDSVCLYIFIPNATRVVYHADEVGEDAVRDFARLHSIQATQSDPEVLRAALARLQESRAEKKVGQTHDFQFVVSDKLVYHSLDQFQSPEARQQAQYWNEGKADLQQNETQLEQLRIQYAQGDAQKRQSLRSQILDLEKQVETAIGQIKTQEKTIRQLELKKLGR